MHDDLLVVEAYRYATSCHYGQVDKAGEDYMGHIERVVSEFEDNTLRIIAYLHDTLEDTDADPNYILETFGEEILDAVQCMTRHVGEKYLYFIKRLSRNSNAAKVKLADLKDNMNLSRLKIIRQVDMERYEKYKKAVRYLEAIVYE